MSQQLQVPSPLSFLERIKAASSLEEVQTMVMELESAGAFNPYNVLPFDPNDLSDPNNYFRHLRKTFRRDLIENPQSITMYKAIQDYDTNYAALSNWIKKGLIRVVAKSPGPGKPSKVNERDVAIMAEMNLRFRSETNKTGTIKGWRPQPLREDED